MAWNFAADPSERRAYPFELNVDSSPWTVDLRPMVREAVTEHLAGSSSARISGRFHATLAQATADVVSRIAELRGLPPVVLTGGCFQNALLTQGVLERLPPRLPVYRNREAPPGDGGIALGQVLVANALARAAGATERRRTDDEKSSAKEQVCASVSPVG
jgi:hydrogenase maturation protein HypF